jgi:hypothetical protein
LLLVVVGGCWWLLVVVGGCWWLVGWLVGCWLLVVGGWLVGGQEKRKQQYTVTQSDHKSYTTTQIVHHHTRGSTDVEFDSGLKQVVDSRRRHTRMGAPSPPPLHQHLPQLPILQPFRHHGRPLPQCSFSPHVPVNSGTKDTKDTKDTKMKHK